MTASAELSRRRFCGLLLSPLVGPAAAAPPTVPAPPDPATVSAALGTRLLRQGLRFDRAAAYFALAGEKDPTNPAHPLALGCAYASRAASLTVAAEAAFRLSQERANFSETVREWEEERDTARAENPEGFSEADFEKSRPVLPPLREFRTKDDSQPYRLTRPQLERRLTELGTAARAAWEKGIALSVTPAQKAQAYYIQGWGLHLLRLSLDGISGREPAAALIAEEQIPKHSESLAALDKATELAPENPLYWQATGDALREFGAKDILEANDPKIDAAITAAYRKAVDLKARNPENLWYLLYSRAAQNASTKPKTEWPLALDYLRRGAARDRGNAWPLYEEAGILFRDAPYSLTGPSGNRDASEVEKETRRAAVRNDAARRNGRAAIDLILDGNRAAGYTEPNYTDSVPPLLAAAWRYWHPFGNPFFGYGRVRELARSAAGYAQFMAEFEKQPDEAERAALSVIGMGNRMLGDWPVKDDPATGRSVIQSLVGAAVAGIGYTYAEKVYETLGNMEKKAAIQAENAAFKQRVEAYRKAVMENLTQSESEGY